MAVVVSNLAAAREDDANSPFPEIMDVRFCPLEISDSSRGTCHSPVMTRDAITVPGKAEAFSFPWLSIRCADKHMDDAIQGALLTHATLCCPAFRTKLSARCCTSGWLKSCKEV